jgi:hypothetical protein
MRMKDCWNELLKHTEINVAYETVTKTVHGDLTITENEEINERLNLLN